MKTYSNLSALLLAFIVEETRTDVKFAITGYDLTKKVTALGMVYSHQQIYRELAKISELSVTVVPQSGKPDRKEYRLADFCLLQGFADRINYASTKPLVFLGIQNIEVLGTAYAYLLQQYQTRLWLEDLVSACTEMMQRTQLEYLNVHLAKVCEAQKNTNWWMLLNQPIKLPAA